MTRLLTLVTLATIFSTTALAAPGPDIEEPEAICDSADFRNQGQWVKCLVNNGVRGKELARMIHDEHQARKGGETTERSKRKAKGKARNAHQKARADVKRGECSSSR